MNRQQRRAAARRGDPAAAHGTGAEAHLQRAEALVRLGRPGEAVAEFDAALALRPDIAAAWSNRGTLLRGLERLEDAAESFRRAVALRPDFPEGWSNLGALLVELGQPAEALACFDRALDPRPDYAEAWTNRGVALAALDRLEEALASHDRALALRPDAADAWSNRGLALAGMRRLDAARESYDRALALRPDHADAAMNRACLDLLTGRLERGWDDYECRWNMPRFAAFRHPFAQPRWQGEALDGRTLLLTAEQGYGDTIQFCRYATLAAERGGRVVLEVPPPLVPLLTGLAGVARVLAQGEARPAFDLHCPLMSLPRLFGTTLETVPAPAAYLRADPARVAFWAPRLADARGPRVGIAWSGNLSPRIDPRRSMPFALLRPLLGAGATLYALQRDLPETDRAALAAVPCVVDLGAEFIDFADTAAVIDRLDLVISIDTAVAHLAAAMGKPTWTMLRACPDWRWLLGRDDSVWYPGMRLFRQDTQGDWPGVVARVARALADLSGVTLAELPAVPTAGAAGLLQAGLAHHQAGRMVEAEAAYRAALAADPALADAPHLLGIVAYQRGQLAEALQLIERAVALQPGNGAFLSNRGLVLAGMGRAAEALASYDRAIALQPEVAEAHSNRGNALRGLGRMEEALSAYAQAAALRPDYPEAWSNRASVLAELGRDEAALAACDRALALRPDFPEALANRGAILARLGRPEEALAACDAALALRPHSAEAWGNRAGALIDLNRLPEALAACDRALAARPDDGKALANRAACLTGLGRPEEALAACDRALALAPDNAEALGNRASALLDLGRADAALAECDRALTLRPGDARLLTNRAGMLWRLDRLDEALASADAALARMPDHVDAWCNRGLALVGLGRIDEARESYASGLARRPDHADCRFSRTWLELLTGNYADGLPGYEERWEMRRFTSPRRPFTQPQWRGEALDGRTILLHAEQGLGDTIQFCRYVPLLAERGATVILEAQAPLLPLLAGLAGVARLVVQGDPLPPFDLHCPLLSLKLAFGTTLATIPAPAAYLRADPARMAAWAPRFAGAAGRRVGLVWAGNTAAKADAKRLMPFATARPLLNAGATVFALQREVPEGDRADLAAAPGLVNLGDGFADFADTAAAIAHLDLVIAVDTAAAHLAGAMGKPVWIMLRKAPDWRWLLDRDDSPWYPSARLFRQSVAGDWAGVVARVGEALAALPTLAERAADPLTDGLALHRAGDIAAAGAAYRAALADEPGDTDALRLLAVLAHQSGHAEEALSLLDRALAADADDPAVLTTQALVLADLGRAEAALEGFDAASRADPAFHDALAGRAAALRRLGRLEEAVAAHDAALAVRPDDAAGWAARGAALGELGRAEAALDSFARALAIQPDFAPALADSAVALLRLDRLEAAQDNLDRLLARDADNAEAWSLRGVVLARLSRLPEAEAAFDRALARRPGLASASLNKAYLLLTQGRYAEGFALHEARWDTERYADARRDFVQPRWRGENPAGSRVLLHAEQGYGDTIQFCRYAPLLAARGATVIVEVPAPLVPLLAGLDGVTQVVARGEALPPFDLHCPLLTLPLLFGTTPDNIPAPSGYLRADPARVEYWAPFLADLPGPRVGLVWSGNLSPRLDPHRSIPFDTLRPLLAAGVSLVALQRDVPEDDLAALAQAPGLVNLGPGCIDFADTAAIVAQLDLVIAVDTAVAHLAAALGKPTWTMLRAAPDWRWLLGRQDSPWYPTMRLFRQTARGDWGGVVARVAAALSERVSGPPAVPPEAALARLDAAIARDGADARLHHDRGLALAALDRLAEAVHAYDRALALDPDLADAASNRGAALGRMARPEEALASYDRALGLRPECAADWKHRGNALLLLGRPRAAGASFDRALRFDPRDPDAWYYRGVALFGQDRAEAALASYDHALALRPDHAEAHVGRAFVDLREGRLEAGWRGQEWRWRLRRPAEPPRDFAQPRWQGERLDGRTILLHAEQGFGDTIQFCRYAPMVAERGGTVILEVQPALVPLLAGLPGVARTIARGEPPPPFDLHCPLPSLPLAFGTALETIPAPPAYLRADPARLARWAARLDGIAGPRVGLVWAGNLAPGIDPNRAMPFAIARALFAAGATPIGLQKQVPEADRADLGDLLNLGPDLADFADTAAAIARLDLVISIDTSVAHLAGALGRPVWLLLSANADWRWLRGREDSPWYPTMRLFRQTVPGDWAEVIARVGAALREAYPAPAAPPPPPDISATERLHAGVGHMRAGRMAEAEAAFRAALATAPNNADALHLLGIAAYQTDRLAKADAWFARALAVNPDSPAVLNNHGLLLTDLQRLPEALDRFDRAIAAAPDFAEAHSNRGNVLRGLARLEDALASYAQALGPRPDYAEALSNHGITLVDLGRPIEALESLDRALAAQPDFVAAHTNRGTALHALRRPAEALASFDRAVALRPDYPEAWERRALALADLGRFGEALGSLDRALALVPGNADLLAARARLLGRQSTTA